MQWLLDAKVPLCVPSLPPRDETLVAATLLGMLSGYGTARFRDNALHNVIRAAACSGRFNVGDPGVV